jgi:uroporphyrinogen decarboxylase
MSVTTSTMTLKNTCFLDACAGREPARTPVWLMRQAGRYLPEYREIRARTTFLELCRTPDLAAEVTVQPIDRLDVDAAILFSDILVVFDAMDVKVEFSPGPVVAEPIRTASQLDGLRFGDPATEIRYVMDAVRACKGALNDRVPLIGFCGAPLTTASYLVEGQGSRDFLHIKGLLFTDPLRFGQLMEKMSDLLARYLLAQIDAGVDAVQIFDSWAAALSPRDYEEHVLPHMRTLVDRVREGGKPVIVFARGNSNLLAKVAEIDADVIGIDWSIDLATAIDLVGEDRVVQGNLDPALLLGTPETLQSRTREIVAAGKKARGHIFNLGHGISKHTDPAMAKLMVETVHGS